MKALLLFLLLVLLVCQGCGDDRKEPASSGPGVFDGQDDDDNAPEPGDEIASGTVGMFLSLELDSRNESWPVIGGTVSWEETDIGVLRYLPAGADLDLFHTTTSSISSNHIYPLTLGDRLFIVSTRSQKLIQQYDVHSGQPVGTACEISTVDLYSGFGIVGDRLFYVDSGGDLMVGEFPCETDPTLLISASDHGINPRYLFGIGEELVSVDTRTFGSYDVRIHDQSTGQVSDIPLAVNEESGLIIDFFAGDDALYWATYQPDLKQLSVLRFAVGEEPTPILSGFLSEELNAGLSIDASGGRVLLVYMDGFPATGGVAHFGLYDVSADAVEELDVDSSFYSQQIFGTQLFLY